MVMGRHQEAASLPVRGSASLTALSRVTARLPAGLATTGVQNVAIDTRTSDVAEPLARLMTAVGALN